jgi:tRNA(Ile)-lysidine synthase
MTADVAQIDATRVGRELVVRSRQPGDRLRPVGLGGSKKVQDILVDRKVNRAERDAVPIVTDWQGRIVWVAGHVIGEEFRVTEGTKAVIILKLRRI